MDQGGSVSLSHKVFPNLDHEIGTHAYKVTVKGRVMERTKGNAVADERLTGRFTVRDNVRCIQELVMPEAAEGVLAAICLKDPFSKGPLMKAQAYGRGDVCPTGGGRVVVQVQLGIGILLRQPEMCRVVNGDREHSVLRIVTDDKYWPRGQILTRNDAVEINQWEATLHRKAETTVIEVVGIRPAVPVAKKPVRSKGVVVWPMRDGCDGKRCFSQNSWLEDALRTNRRDPDSIKNKALDQDRAGQHVAVPRDLIREPREGCGSDSRVTPWVNHAFPMAWRLLVRSPATRARSWSPRD